MTFKTSEVSLDFFFRPQAVVACYVGVDVGSDLKPEHRAALASNICSRQWPQARCFRAGLTPHPKCLRLVLIDGP